MKSKQNKRKTLTGVAAIFLILIYFATSFAGEVTCIYDNLNRLKGVEDENGARAEYTYDEAGNVIMEVIHMPPIAESVTSPSSAKAPLSVNFKDLSKSCTKVQHQNVDDGSAKTFKDLSHSYKKLKTDIVPVDVSGPAIIKEPK